MPNICVGKLPVAFGRSDVDERKIWIVETPAERAALIDALSKPVPMHDGAVDFASRPDAAVGKADENKHHGNPVAGSTCHRNQAGHGSVSSGVQLFNFPITHYRSGTLHGSTLPLLSA